MATAQKTKTKTDDAAVAKRIADEDARHKKAMTNLDAEKTKLHEIAGVAASIHWDYNPAGFVPGTNNQVPRAPASLGRTP